MLMLQVNYVRLYVCGVPVFVAAAAGGGGAASANGAAADANAAGTRVHSILCLYMCGVPETVLVVMPLRALMAS